MNEDKTFRRICNHEWSDNAEIIISGIKRIHK